MLRIIENSKECISENCEKCESREAIPNSHTCCLLLSINHDEDVSCLYENPWCSCSGLPTGEGY